MPDLAGTRGGDGAGAPPPTSPRHAGGLDEGDEHGRDPSHDRTGASSPVTREGDNSDDEQQPGKPPRKRQRVRLSCLECRRRVSA